MAALVVFTSATFVACNPYLPTRYTAKQLFQTYAPSTAIVKAGSQTGTGFLVHQTPYNVYLVTNYHVVIELLDEENVSLMLNVHFFGGQDIFDTNQHSIHIIGYDEYFDLAVLRIENVTLYKPRVPIRHTNSNPQTAQELLAIGSIDGTSLSAFGGLMSNPDHILDFGISQSDAMRPPRYRFVPVYQVSVNLNPGTSGGPVLDMYGNLVGVSAFQQPFDTEGRPLIGVSFAIPATIAMPLIKHAISNPTGGAISRMSVYADSIQSLESTSLGHLRLTRTLDGTYCVQSVSSLSPSGTLGTWLQADDVLTSIGNTAVAGFTWAQITASFIQYFPRNALSSTLQTEPLSLTFMRGNQTHTVTIDSFVMQVAT